MLPEPEDNLEDQLDPVEDADMLEEAEDFSDPMEELLQERDQLRDQLLRTMADLQNLRKRSAQELQQVRKYATEDLMREILPVLDNFQRTLDAAEAGATHESLVEGVTMVNRQLRSLLEARGLRPVVTVGAPFDPEMHEAVGTDPATEETPADSVTVEVEGGYWLGDRVLRPARVRVSR